MKRYSSSLIGTMLQDENGGWVTHADHLAAIEQAQAWKQAVDDLLATWYTTADSYATPREAVKALIAFEVNAALDPAVSSDAAALVERGRKEEREECAQACIAQRDGFALLRGQEVYNGAINRCIAAIRARKP